MHRWVLVLLAGCSFAGVQGSGAAKTEVRQVAAFSAIELAGSFDVEVSIGPLRLELSGDDNLLPLIASDVTGDKLVLRSTQSMRRSLPLLAKISVPRLTWVKVSGSGGVTLHGITADALTIGVSGSGNVRGDGTAHQLSAEVTGSGDLELATLAVERATVTLSGSGNVEVDATNTLDVRLSGSGSVKYHGNPQVTKSISGSGGLVKQ
jgi:hypothetical protein